MSTATPERTMDHSEAKNLVRRLRRKAHAAYRRLRSIGVELAEAQRALVKAQLRERSDPPAQPEPQKQP